MIYRTPERFSSGLLNKYTTNDLYDMAVYYAKQHGLQWTFSRDKMMKEFKKEFEQYYTRNREGQRYYLFPELSKFTKQLTVTRPELITDPDTE